MRAVGVLDEALEGVREELLAEALALVGDDERDAAPALRVEPGAQRDAAAAVA